MISLEALYSIFCSHPKISTDSRKMLPGSLFFSLKGERFNGNEYARRAIRNGAAYALIDEPAFRENERYLLVDDCLKMLQRLANYHRRRFSIPLIAITGSNGKTTTKELVGKVLGKRYRTHFTQGNLNNHIGVPLTLLEMPPEAEIAVVEMGANHPGEIDFLCQIAEPTHGLITNIGKAHLEGFGNLEGVKQTKSELYRYLEKQKGLVFINLDEPFLQELAGGNSRKVNYKQSDAPHPQNGDFEVKLLSVQPFVEVAFLSEKRELLSAKSQLIGAYNFPNIMTAIALGNFFKVPAEKIKSAIENHVPANNRSQILEIDPNTFILDAYNANPDSMKNALNHFAQMKAPKKIAILGDMLELGDHSQKEHRKILEFAIDCRFDKLVVVGKEFAAPAKEQDVLHFGNLGQLKRWFEQQHFEKTHFLVKGSRGVGLEKMFTPEG